MMGVCDGRMGAMEREANAYASVGGCALDGVRMRWARLVRDAGRAIRTSNKTVHADVMHATSSEA